MKGPSDLHTEVGTGPLLTEGDAAALKHSGGFDVDSAVPPPPYSPGANGDQRVHVGAVESKLPPEGFRVPTKSCDIGLGFPYPQALCEKLELNQPTWDRFNEDITKCVSLTRSQERKVKSLAMASASMEFNFGVWGLDSGFEFEDDFGDSRHARETARLALTQLRDTAEPAAGAMTAVLDRWNDECFAPRGVRVHMDVPDVLKNIKADTSEHEAKQIWKRYRDELRYTLRQKLQLPETRFRLVFVPIGELATGT